jgi:hypothetical protein
MPCWASVILALVTALLLILTATRGSAKAPKSYAQWEYSGRYRHLRSRPRDR